MRCSRRSVGVRFIGVAGLFWAIGAAAAQAPVDRVESFHEVLLATMRIGDFDDRVAHLQAPVEALFDFPTISRISLGRNWGDLDETDREAFVDLLKRLVVATYAGRFKTFSGQAFATTGSAQTRRGWMVKTRLSPASGDVVSLDYHLTEVGVYNVVADGVSDLSLRRADYNSILKAEGFAALLTHLEQNILAQRSVD